MKILVEDDDPDFMDLAREVLENNDFGVSVARGVDESMALVESETPALILLDVMMARIDSGFRFLLGAAMICPGTC